LLGGGLRLIPEHLLETLQPFFDIADVETGWRRVLRAQELLSLADAGDEHIARVAVDDQDVLRRTLG